MDNTLTAHELRLNGMTGPLLASGEFISETLNTMAVRYDPATGMVGASVSGMELGSYPANLAATPKFVGFEGVGILDNFVVRACTKKVVPTAALRPAGDPAGRNRAYP